MDSGISQEDNMGRTTEGTDGGSYSGFWRSGFLCAKGMG